MLSLFLHILQNLYVNLPCLQINTSILAIEYINIIKILFYFFFDSKLGARRQIPFQKSVYGTGARHDLFVF